MHSCEICGNEFDSLRGKNVHRSRSHGKREVECGYCSKTFTITPSRINEDGKNFCSDECHSKGMSGENNPSYGNTNRVTVSCDNCGKEFERIESHANRYSRNFCSEECVNFKGENNPFYGKSHSEKMKKVMPSGEDHWNFGEERPEHAEKISEMFEGEGNPMYGVRGEDAPMYGVTGEDHPNWQGGENREDGYYYYEWRHSTEWFEARREALDRDDNKCQDCGTSEDLHVHHIESVSEGGSKFDTGNLITLCQEHHYERH